MTVQKWLHKFFKAFVYAGRGIPDALHERNMKVHMVAAVVATCLGLLIGLSKTEWMLIFLCFGGVMALEMVNTAVEELANLLRDTNHLSYDATRRARDVAAGAVLIMAMASAVIGCLIFLPKLF